MKRSFTSWPLLSILLLASTAVSADVFVASANGGRIFQYDQTTGAFIKQFDPTSVQYPEGVALGPDGYLYTAPTDATNGFNSHVDRFDPVTGHLLASFGALPQTRGMTIGPDGLIYVSAANSHQIWRYNPTTSAFVDVFASLSFLPETLAFGPDGNLYVCSTSTDSVMKFNGTTGALISQFITEPGLSPQSIAFGPDGNVYVGSSNLYPNQVRRYVGATGAFDRVFASSASLRIASSMAFGPDGNLYVGSSLNASVLRFNGATGAFVDIFIPSGSGGLGSNLTGILFTNAGFLSFPLKSNRPNVDDHYTSKTAPVNSLFDHSMLNKATGFYKIYGCDKQVIAFTAVLGQYHAVSVFNSKKVCNDAYSVTKPPSQVSLSPYANYRGPGGDNEHLYYDGHPGIDYQAADGTQVFASVSGKVYYPKAIVGIKNTDQFNILEIVPDSTAVVPSHVVYYLHLSTYKDQKQRPITDPSPAAGCAGIVMLPIPEGTHVQAGCLVALSGHAAPYPLQAHLHFEVHAIVLPTSVLTRFGARSYGTCVDGIIGTGYDCIPVDPYGWTGPSTTCDPLTGLPPVGEDPYVCLTGLRDLKPLWK